MNTDWNDERRQRVPEIEFWCGVCNKEFTRTISVRKNLTYQVSDAFVRRNVAMTQKLRPKCPRCNSNRLVTPKNDNA